MNIIPLDVTIGELIEGFEDNAENGVKAYEGIKH